MKYHPSVSINKLLLTLLLLVINVGLCSAQKVFSIDKAGLMPVGAYYYPEQWPESEWDQDLKRMSELGFTFTHMGEFAWSRFEPREGEFDFTWLDKALKLANDHKLKVILCTPTPTPPAWLTYKHPEILAVNSTGIQQQHGSRLSINPTHPTYLKYVQIIVEKLGERYGKDIRVLGWQLDNEPHIGILYDYSQGSQEEFKTWLENKYGMIKNLNFAWGTPFWSQDYNEFKQISIPNANEAPQGPNPHALLDYQRFTSDKIAHFLRFQADILKKYVSKNQFITTNYAYYKFLPTVDLFKNQNDLDFASHTMYLTSTYLNYPAGKLAGRLGSGMELAFSAEFAKSINGHTGIMELQPGQINWGAYNSQPLPGAVRMWVWHSFGLGDDFVCTYRFKQPIYGGEQSHKGILETDGKTVSPGGLEYVKAIKEIGALKKIDASAKMPADLASRRTAFLWKQDNLFDLSNAPINKNWDTWQHYYTYYENLKTLGAPVTFIQEKDNFDPAKYPFITAPAYQLIDSSLVTKWTNYVKQGGHLILSVRTGQKDHNGHFWKALLQQPIWDLIGAKILYNDQLAGSDEASVLFGDKKYSWNVWSEILEVLPQKQPTEMAKVWATYNDQFYAGFPSVISRKLGKGTVTYMGVWTKDGELERQVLRKVYQQAGAQILDMPRYAFTEWRDGYWVTVNYTSDKITAPLTKTAEIIYGTKEVNPGDVCVWIDKETK